RGGRGRHARTRRAFGLLLVGAAGGKRDDNDAAAYDGPRDSHKERFSQLGHANLCHHYDRSAQSQRTRSLRWPISPTPTSSSSKPSAHRSDAATEASPPCTPPSCSARCSSRQSNDRASIRT